MLDSRLATRDYRHQLLAAMPPFRRIIDLDEACAFLEHAAGHVPASLATVVAPPREVSDEDQVAIRSAVGCPECGSQVARRCRDAEGYTLAFLHPARIAVADAEEGA